MKSLNQILGSQDDKHPKVKPKSDDILTEATEAFTRASNAENKNRINWLDDWRFARLSEQWPEEMRRQREIDCRPCLTINRLPAFLRQVTNNARLNKPSIRTHPVGDGADQATSKILNGLIRNIEVSSNADVAYDTALDHAVTGGFGYIRVTTDYADDDAFDQDIRIERVANPLTVYGDPDCMDADSANWNTAFVTDLYRRSEFERKWPDAQETNWQADNKEISLEWMQDDMIRVAEYWKREEVPTTLILLSNDAVLHKEDYEKDAEMFGALGITIVNKRASKTHKVTQYIVSGAEVLETNQWAGRYIPIVPVYGDEVILEGEKHYISMVRYAKDPQRQLNYWKTASTELVALAPKAPFIGPRGTFATDSSKWQSANVTNHAYLEYDPVTDDSGNTMPGPQRQPFAGPPAGALQEAANAQDDMKSVMGLFDASLGARSNETSGIAINQRKQQGDVSTFNFIDNQARALRHIGRIIVDLIPHVYNAARIIRVIHEDGTNESVSINQPAPQPGMPPQGPQQPGMPPQMGATPPNMPPQGMPGGAMLPPPSQDAATDAQGIARIYDLTCGKYDVTVDTGPSYATKREEAAEQIMEFMKAYPQAGPLIADLVAKNSDWAGAEEIAERLRAMLPPPLQGKNPQVQQMQAQMAQMDAHAKEAVHTLQGQIQQTQSQAQQALKELSDQLEQSKQQLAAAKTDKEIDIAKAKIDVFNAETNRLKVLGTTLTPEMVQQLAQQTVMEAMQQPNPAGIPDDAGLQDGAMQEQQLEPELGPDGQPIPPAPTPEQMAQQEAMQRHQQVTDGLGQVMGVMQQVGQHLQNLHQVMSAPRKLVRDEKGRPSGSVVDMPPPDESPDQQPQQGPSGPFSMGQP